MLLQNIVSTVSNDFLYLASCKSLVQTLRSNIGRSSFKYRAALVWNNPPVDLKKVTSYDSFKKRLSKNSKILETISFNNFSFKQRDNHFNYFKTIFK